MRNLVITDFAITAGVDPVDFDLPAGTPPVEEILWARLLQTPAIGGNHTEVDLTVMANKAAIIAVDQIAVVDENTLTIRPTADILIHDTLHLNVLEKGERVLTS
ncbi:unnamed protein product [marine sediment metagenome]|uniref:Uncharacterized protein n=1 Tax=marine sediment metagenome TaxID=412755 RepID=X1URC7_9ZZZZ